MRSGGRRGSSSGHTDDARNGARSPSTAYTSAVIFPGLLTMLGADETISATCSDALRRTPTALDLTIPESFRAVLTTLLAETSERMILLVASTYREAEALTAEVAALCGEDAVAYYPAWEVLPHERLSPRADTVGRRLSVLRRIVGAEETQPKVVVAPIRSLLQPQAVGLANLLPVTITVGDEHDLTQLAADLVNAAYHRVDLVERRGEFAVRGGIVDVFPPTLDHPVRVDFFGDQVEAIRHFGVADQRSMGESLDSVVASPCRELLLTPEVRARAKALIISHPELTELLDRIVDGHAVEGMEALTPVLADGLELLIDVLPPDALVCICDPELVAGRAAELHQTSQEFLNASWAAAAGGGQAPIDLGASAYWTLAEVRSHALERGQGWWTLSPFQADDQGVPSGGLLAEDGELVDLSHLHVSGVVSRTLEVTVGQGWRGDPDAVIANLAASVSAGWAVVIGVDGRGLGQRIVEILSEHEIPARWLDSLDEPPQLGQVTILHCPLRHGWRSPSVRLELLTSADLFGQTAPDKGERKMPSRRKNQIQPLELRAGDYVVHDAHGVGRFIEMVQRTTAGATREYLVIEYAPSKRGHPGDRLYVPMDQLDQLTRYIGGEAPSLDRMGGADWNKRKARARRAVREIAAELIKLYAARQATKGHAFGPDSPWQRELEDAFSYVETADQLAAISEVKADMEQVVPMDRLICGDVGYGKTEIAVRAAFKAVQDGKQVAILVPTTLLVQQHYQTFASRYAGFPVNIVAMSRFQSDTEIADALTRISSGRADIVIGTHRLLSKEVSFRNLGLVIIDEEQRFGVEHKERLKQLRVNVDVLAMSATPIPRTLEMAITGIREMSVIATPPEERHPVLTFTGPYDEAQITAAIRRELAREGQVFFVHNRVSSINKIAARLRELVPEARVVTAHGQMGEKTLEQVMVDFWERRADVLVSTTIVEAGLDIASANTLIVDRADTLGLSQLHQLRGRVGRSRERGYCYFMYPADKVLTETAHERLATMSQHTDLGAGMRIAMRDLEIRGAGNLLGGEQSGHIADVGFDLYVRLVGEAVADFRGEDTEPEPEMRIELPVDAHLPDHYVPSERLRLEGYKRLAEVRSLRELEEVVEEWNDRYGSPPEPVDALVNVARFRLRCRELGIAEVVAQGPNVRLAPVILPESRQLRLKRLYPGSIIKEPSSLILVPRPKTGTIPSSFIEGPGLLDWASALVEAILGD